MSVNIKGDPAKIEEAVRLELARRWFLPFCKVTWPGFQVYPVQRLVAQELQHFEQSLEQQQSPRLIFELPPRVGKSEMASRRFPPWLLGRHPDWNVFLVSYGAELAEELSADARRVVMSDEYRAIFGMTYQAEKGDSVELDRTSKSVSFWRIADHRGALRAVGVGGALTGRGADCLIVDDPLKGRKEADSQNVKDDLWTFYKGTLYTRLEPGAGIIIMATRWAVDDLIGRVLDEAQADPDADQWRVLRVSAEAEPDDPLGRPMGQILEGRFGREQLEQIKRTVGPREWASQYQQRPVPEEGAILRPLEWCRFEDQPPGYVGPRYLFADTSYARTRKSDYTNIQVWQMEPNGSFGLLELYRERLQFPDLKRMARRMYLKWGCWAGVVEDWGSGTSLIQEFQRESGMQIRSWRPDRDKEARAHAAADVMASGVKRVRLPRNASWLQGLIKELMEFPAGGFDDQVDVFTMAMILLGTHDVERRRRWQGNFDFELVG